MKTLAIIQARLGSTRFPRKILKHLSGKPILLRMIERVERSSLIDEIVIATTDKKGDDPIYDLCCKIGISCFRGHELDLLDRHYRCAEEYKANVVLKIPSDCPLIDSEIIDGVIEKFLTSKSDYTSNLHPPSFPDGVDVEVFSFDALKNAWINAKKDYEREHTTPYIWDNPDKFKISNFEWETGLNFSETHRLTLDYEEDYLFIRKVFSTLYNKNYDFKLKDILKLLDEEKDLMEINKMHVGVHWYSNHLDDLKTK